MGFNVQRGYHVQIYGNRRAPLMKVRELPKHFLNPLEGKNTIAFTTEEIIQADKRGQEALCEITVMSNSIIEELLQGVRESIGCLYKVRHSLEMTNSRNLSLSLFPLYKAQRDRQPLGCHPIAGGGVAAAGVRATWV